MMGKLRANESGFSVVEAVLIVVIVAIIGFVGWYVWHAKQTTDKVNSDTTKSASSTLPAVKKSTAGSSAADQQLIKNIKGYDTLPADFKPFILARYEKTEENCKTNPNAVANGLSAGGQVMQVVRNEFISINEQQADCDGGGATYYSKVNGKWQFDFVATQAPSCDLVNKYSYTKEIIPRCYPRNSSDSVPNTHP